MNIKGGKRNIRLKLLLKYYRWIHVPKLQGQVLSLLFSSLPDQEQGVERERSVREERQKQRVEGLLWAWLREAGLQRVVRSQMRKTVQ